MARKTQESTNVASIRVCNANDSPLVLCLEPWGREYQLKSEQVVQIVFEAKTPGEPEVIWESNRVVAYGWEGSIAHVFSDGVNLDDDGAALEALIAEIFGRYGLGERFQQVTPDLINDLTYAQERLDHCVDWSKESQEAACLAAGIVACPLAKSLGSSKAVSDAIYSLCQSILASRGRALKKDKDIAAELLNAATSEDELAVVEFLSRMSSPTPTARRVELRKPK